MIAIVISRSSPICFNRSIVLLVSARAIPAVGSSNKSSRGSWLRHIPISNRRLSPLDIEDACIPCLFDIFISSNIFSAPSTISLCFIKSDSASNAKDPSLLANIGIIIFSITLKSPNISGVWKTRDIPIWFISYGDLPKTEFPSNRTVPVSGKSLPTRQFSKVDLPAPLGPIIA